MKTGKYIPAVAFLALLASVVVHWLHVQNQASGAAALLNLAMTEAEVVASLGTPPDREGTWSGSYGAGKFFIYEYSCLWDHAVRKLNQDLHPRQVVVTFDEKELVREIGLSGAYSKTTRVVKRSEAK